MIDFEIVRNLPIGESPMLLLRVFQDGTKIPLASLSPQKINGMVTLAWKFLKRSNKLKLKVIKSGNCEMVMEVFQLVFNAYSSLVMMYGWCFNEESRGNLKEMQILNLRFLKV
jgi:ribosome biogenesis protein Nip4